MRGRGTTWRTLVAAMRRAETAAAVQDRTAACERLAVDLDGGIGGSAIAAIIATPPGPARELELAKWARRIVDGPDRIAIVIDDGFGPDEMKVLAQLHARVQGMRGGGR